jgi:hypothetical protein
LIDGIFGVVLEDGTWLGGVQSIAVDKTVGEFGEATLKVILPRP